MKQFFTCLLTACLFIAPFKVCQSQTVDFSYVTRYNSIPCNPQFIIFTGTYTGSPVAFLWDFGNNQKGTTPTAVFAYDSAGTYNVVFTVIYPDKALSTTKTVIINATPTLQMSADKINLCIPGAVNFSVAGSTNISSLTWDFGDGTQVQTSEGNTISHQYTDYGNYTATVKAITAAGCSTTVENSISIAKPSITASIIPNNGCVPAVATLGVITILPPGDRVIRYNWNFGDGATSNGTDSIISHNYTITDSMVNASVAVTTQDGCSNQLVFPPFAYGTPPVNTSLKTVLQQDSFCASEKIAFSFRADKANEYKIDFGDTSSITVTDTLASHKYRLLGPKKIVVTPYFNGCAGAPDSISIFIKGVVSDFTYSNLCTDKRAYQFTDASKGNITKHRWTITTNDLITDSVSTNPSQTFPPYGTYPVSLFLYDSITGCSDVTIYNIYTAVPAITRSATSICKDDSVNYTVSASYPDSAGYTYLFYVAGDSLDNGKDSVLNLHPSVHGQFPDYVVIKDNIEGTCNDTLRLSDLTVRGPLLSFTIPDRICAGTAMEITNNSHPFFAADAITGWDWSFGDSVRATGQNPPPYRYSNAGTYTVRLTATDINGCTQYEEKSILNYRSPLIAVFPKADTICGGRDSAMLIAYATDTLSWMPATNIGCTSCDTTMVYPSGTTYYVAKAKNWLGCTSYDTAYITVFKPIDLKISPADTAICPGSQVQLNLNITNGITQWSPALTGDLSHPLVMPVRDSIFTAIVTDSAGCYTDTASMRIHVYTSPQVNAGEDKLLPYGSIFTISPVFSSNVTNYSWTPAKDLTCNTCPFPSGTALQNTTYTIQVLSADGCRATDKVTIAIQCDQSNLTMPTAFSPNGNGINEYYYPIAKGYRNIRKFVIFNRLGNKVFERQNFAPNVPSLGWDGIIRGAETVTASETFVWFMEAECQQGEILTAKGTVTLVK